VEIRWKEFERLVLVRRLRQAIGKWWGVQINFTDDKGYLRGVPSGRFFSPITSACKYITRSDNGFQGCMKAVRNTKNLKTKVSLGSESTCHAGFTTITVPIYHKKKYLGCIFADGFVSSQTEKKQKKQIDKFLSNHFSSKSQVKELVAAIPSLEASEVSLLVRLIQVIIDEVIAMQFKANKAEASIKNMQNSIGGVSIVKNNMIGTSQEMQRLQSTISSVASSSSTILIEGENGTGKELVARALHSESKRSKKPFVILNCGSLNENLLESELFGAVKGAYTGATQGRVGVFEAANNGTLFLDEIGDTSAAMQVKLLRVTQYKTFSPVGSTQEKKTNARLICATNKNLFEMVQKGEFREDLYYRLNVIRIEVPPLRERKGDIPLIINHFLTVLAKTHGSGIAKVIPQKCLDILLKHNWPGNIRELQNEIERLWVLSGNNSALNPADISTRIKGKR